MTNDWRSQMVALGHMVATNLARHRGMVNQQAVVELTRGLASKARMASADATEAVGAFRQGLREGARGRDIPDGEVNPAVVRAIEEEFTRT